MKFIEKQESSKEVISIREKISEKFYEDSKTSGYFFTVLLSNSVHLHKKMQASRLVLLNASVPFSSSTAINNGPREVNLMLSMTFLTRSYDEVIAKFADTPLLTRLRKSHTLKIVRFVSLDS